jgi:membrane protease YdiL (CAAX protease family)
VRWQRIDVEAIRIDRPRAELGFLLAFTAFFVGMSGLTGLLIRRWPMPVAGAASFTEDLWYIVVFKLLALLVLPCAVCFSWGYRPRDLLLDWRPTPRRLTGAFLAFVAGLALNASSVSRILGAAPMGTGDLVLRSALAIVTPLLAAGLPEEIVYRGLLQTRLERAGGRVVAILGSAALFAAWHIPSRYLLSHGVEGQAGHLGSVLLATALPVFIVGLVFGVLWDRYRRIVPLIAAHWGVDLLPALTSYLGVSV